jgi:hypothetical protein
MMRATTERLFAGVMAAAGLAAGWARLQWPQATDLVAGYLWPFIAAFLFDVAIRPAVADGRLSPLAMPTRIFGVIGGTIVFAALEKLAV